MERKKGNNESLFHVDKTRERKYGITFLLCSGKIYIALEKKCVLFFQQKHCLLLSSNLSSAWKHNLLLFLRMDIFNAKQNDKANDELRIFSMASVVFGMCHFHAS